MKKLIAAVLVLLLLTTTVYAHSGRTDANGGHKDPSNVSGLGPYHYHHGYGPHLHPNGVCPYDSPSTAASSSGVSRPSGATAPSTAKKTDAQKAAFLDEYIALIQSDGSTLYHRLDCPNFDSNAGFFAYNIAAAEQEGYSPCTKCHS